MNQTEMIQSLRAEIAKLQRVLDLLLDASDHIEENRRPGRPKGSGNRATSVSPEEVGPKRRTMSAEGKARIAAAQKKRWAAQKVSSSDRVIRKQAAPAKRTSKAAPLKSVKKLAPSAATKGAGAGKRTGLSAPTKRQSTVPIPTKAAKKSTPGKSRATATKQPAKQATPPAPELQTTA